ncbi:hypothetical protein SNOG_00762 [Parastagonospora nodorum SN15]|uniref:Uncharacterized protein n=1 Tax=Phaeosphaeria nodorum (strain SN15 / ATCC MYA-4574 / FGSC 10173) TaxID=321614 RepID=Q0V5F2_PHANO|nr:hypothetical protein SNOG_00762 [Parastagonospora nodorum SN15]EAT92257.1 hypothetical protein SNOG_00762 [Parastagonospora nodorum SN15]
MEDFYRVTGFWWRRGFGVAWTHRYCPHRPIRTASPVDQRKLSTWQHNMGLVDKVAERGGIRQKYEMVETWGLQRIHVAGRRSRNENSIQGRCMPHNRIAHRLEPCLANQDLPRSSSQTFVKIACRLHVATNAQNHRCSRTHLHLASAEITVKLMTQRLCKTNGTTLDFSIPPPQTDNAPSSIARLEEATAVPFFNSIVVRTTLEFSSPTGVDC